ncbi:MAG TPA: 3-carboxy-cis,cis-muconate cycloisomerase, partial [Caulobacteraceae bacterium]|nr:3-carboxy-cis,cis-muconate cycloisomerase [Caulobacteraceae bacterium]
MVSRIHDLAGSTPEMLAVFADRSLVDKALAFERELARAQAAEGLLTDEEAAAIAAASAIPPDVEALGRAAAHAGTLAIPLVAELRARLAQAPAAAAKVHLGATSQDLADTALMLQAREAVILIAHDGARLNRALAGLARTHAATPMLGRTLLQPARPITFGLKAAGWRLGVAEALSDLQRDAGAAVALQFGGAAGTLEGLGGRGLAAARRLADALELALPTAPWHTRRNGVAKLASNLAILVGALAKMATDIALLSQFEVGEAFEPREAGRGGSSAMAYKRNPTGCQVCLSAAVRAPHLAATILAALPQEHERSLGGWQAEAAVLAELFCLAHGALAAMA